MKKKFLLIFSIFSLLFYGQKIDTLEINQFKTVQIIFNDDITYVEAGTGDLQVKNKIVDNILILQSIVPDNEFIATNLFIKTKGNVYNPMIKYNENPIKSTLLEKDLQSAIGVDKSQTNKTQPIQSSLSKGSLQNGKNPKIKKTEAKISPEGSDNKEVAIEDKLLFKNITDRNDIFKPSRQYTTSVWFRFFAHYIEDGKYYFKFELENESSLDYHLGNIFFSVQTLKKRKVSETKREIEIIKNINPITVVSAKSKKYLVFKFDSFSMNKDEEFIIEITEKGGARNFSIGIPYYIINKPIKL